MWLLEQVRVSTKKASGAQRTGNTGRNRKKGRKA